MSATQPFDLVRIAIGRRSGSMQVSRTPRFNFARGTILLGVREALKYGIARCLDEIYQRALWGFGVRF